MTTDAVLIELIYAHKHHDATRQALVDALYAIRRITWTPAPVLLSPAFQRTHRQWLRHN